MFMCVVVVPVVVFMQLVIVDQVLSIPMIRVEHKCGHVFHIHFLYPKLI